jgi:hypothetical protein
MLRRISAHGRVGVAGFAKFPVNFPVLRELPPTRERAFAPLAGACCSQRIGCVSYLVT